MDHQTGQKNTTEDIATAIYIVNKHAKVASKSSNLYMLKKEAISKLLKEKKGKKTGLHYSPRPGLAQQRLDVLVEVGTYHFHVPSTAEDRKQLPLLGNRNPDIRNPKKHMSLSKAKKLLSSYVGMAMGTPQPSKRPKPSSTASTYKGLSTYLNN